MNKKTMYTSLCKQLEALIIDTYETISIMANTSALLYMSLPDINWAGFYLQYDNHLILGPFQGKPACITIPFGIGVCGVCGVCASTKCIQCVENVHEFPTHIACDSESQSEIVLPIIMNNELFGVLDIDSASLARFDNEDKVGLQAFVSILTTRLQNTRKTDVTY